MQAYKDLHGQEKYDKAAEWLAARAGEAGLKLTPDEIKGLIEAVLRELKDEFGEEWGERYQPWLGGWEERDLFCPSVLNERLMQNSLHLPDMYARLHLDKSGSFILKS